MGCVAAGEHTRGGCLQQRRAASHRCEGETAETVLDTAQVHAPAVRGRRVRAREARAVAPRTGCDGAYVREPVGADGDADRSRLACSFCHRGREERWRGCEAARVLGSFDARKRRDFGFGGDWRQHVGRVRLRTEQRASWQGNSASRYEDTTTCERYEDIRP